MRLNCQKSNRRLTINCSPFVFPVPALATLQAENDELRNKLAEVVPEVTRLAEALTREMELTAGLNESPSGIA